MKEIVVKGIDVKYQNIDENDYICITDIAKYKTGEADSVIANWMRNRNTVEFLGIWETLNNPNFNPIEFEGFRRQAGLNAFVLSPKKWIESTNAIGIVSKAGRYGGTYAHKDIAFEFASWISVEFKLYFKTDFRWNIWNYSKIMSCHIKNVYVLKFRNIYILVSSYYNHWLKKHDFLISGGDIGFKHGPSTPYMPDIPYLPFVL